jgi:acyl-CoA synthetase (AMP-forming)/AMP-acid ligase II
MHPVAGAKMKFSERLAAITSLNPDLVALEFEGAEFTWGVLSAAASKVRSLLDEAGVPSSAPVGWMARNAPEAVAAILGILQGERFVSPLNPHQPAARLIDEIAALRLAAMVGSPADWAIPAFAEAVGSVGGAGVEIDFKSGSVVLRPGLDRIGPGPHRPPAPGYAIERMTSGTTGAPKRFPLRTPDLELGLLAAAPSREAAKAAAEHQLAPMRDTAILHNPFAHSAGLMGLVTALYFGRRICLHQKFDPLEWAEAVARYKPKSAGLVPAMINMVLDASVPKEKLGSLVAVRSGTAPLDPARQKAFQTAYGIPILIDYGASEFIGGITGWTLRDYQEWGEAKLGSVGRPKPGVSVRIVDADSGLEVRPGEVGRLEAKADRFGPDWVNTTDLASVDEDGFVYIRGRADEAIIRGGFKILPDKVAEILRLHPAVRDAVVLAVRHERLGQAPIAVIELRAGAERPDKAALDAVMREHLPAYFVPEAYEFVPALPRTPSLKIARPAVKAAFADRYSFS